jgi:hypothetical protein
VSAGIVAVSVDMEGVSQLRGVREIGGCLPEYWETGGPGSKRTFGIDV